MTKGTTIPSPRRGDCGNYDTPLPRVTRSLSASLHPWLQPCAPSGRPPVLDWLVATRYPAAAGRLPTTLAAAEGRLKFSAVSLILKANSRT